MKRTRTAAMLTAPFIGISLIAAPAPAHASTPPPSPENVSTTVPTPEILSLSNNEMTARRGSWHRIWGPAFVWPNSRYPGNWSSKPFKSKSKILGINFRCWRWRGASKAWLGITGTDGYLRAKTPYAACDGYWKTVHWKKARKGQKYRVTLHNFPAVKAPWEVKAYNYW
ncbi:hypothetical protein [Actinomadura rudentiformis]|uniref:Uncharacterized protein n=1 Tax=Actinomadura rudentiformis TaxID=359158 RepID=A0A6H9YXK7_9ACTN|nr:hypothetical protein [Actinomadura rudentiformis]KAB2345937.1 hypothetical protein F8566_24775 [Actinomadura rudentiformis]